MRIPYRPARGSDAVSVSIAAPIGVSIARTIVLS
jgi:hypothetical protein